MPVHNGASYSVEKDKHESGVEQNTVSLNHSFTLVLVGTHNLPRDNRSQSECSNVLEDAVEGRCGVLRELRNRTQQDAATDGHDAGAKEEEEPVQDCKLSHFKYHAHADGEDGRHDAKGNTETESVSQSLALVATDVIGKYCSRKHSWYH